MKKIGVIGAGVMGVGVAQSAAQAGYDVILIDVSMEILDKAKAEILKNIRFGSFFGKKTSSSDTEKLLARIHFETDYELFKDVDFLVENATENWDVKKEIYQKINAICKEDCVFAVNTSAISITKIASLTNRPAKVIGMHFMNPVPLKPVVETIRGYLTTEETIDVAKAFLSKMNKEAIVVDDYPGFVSNRVLMLTINEAIFLLQDNIATIEDIDRIFKECFGHKMGPLETADLIGLDTILFSVEVLYESYNDSKYRPCPLLKKMVDAGYRGRKNGLGFYNYTI